MSLILKHKRKTSMRWKFPQGGFVMVHEGFADATNLDERKKEMMLKHGFSESSADQIPDRVKRFFKNLYDNTKECETEGCNGRIDLGIRGSHFAKYCKKCQESKKKKVA